MSTAGPMRARALVRAVVVTTVLAGAWWMSGASQDESAPGWTRLLDLLRGLSAPDLSTEALTTAGVLAIETTAVAMWGTAMGAVAGLAIALLASRSLATSADTLSLPRRVRLQLARGLVDLLRAIPDFAWALVVLVFIGAGPVTGALAIAISVTGLLGKTYSQLLDATPPSKTEVVDATGSATIVRALWGHIPAAAGPMLSYTLLRLECSMRNASVIGIVGGGGLGAALFEELGFARYDRVATLLLTLLLLTAATDRTAKAIGTALRLRRGPSRRALLGLTALALGLCLVPLWPALMVAIDELARLDHAFLSATAEGLLSPTLTVDALGQRLADSGIVLGIAIVSTALAAAAAIAVVWVVPRHTTIAATVPAPLRVVQQTSRLAVDALALVTRAVPDVVWLLLLGVALRAGALAAVIAIALHSFGLLARLCVEATQDAVHLDRSGQRPLPSLGPPRTHFAWVVWPTISATVWTHVSLQGETNLRASLIVGIVGAGGLGDAFHTNIAFWRLGDATVDAVAMIILTVVVDRLARRFTRARPRRRPAPLAAATADTDAR